MKVNSQVPLISFLIFLSLTALYGCKKDERTKNDKLIERFEGRYKVLKAISSQSVDLDLNGSSSSDLFFEIPNLENSQLDLRLKTQSGSFIYSQLWPDQYVRT